VRTPVEAASAALPAAAVPALAVEAESTSVPVISGRPSVAVVTAPAAGAAAAAVRVEGSPTALAAAPAPVEPPTVPPVAPTYAPPAAPVDAPTPPSFGAGPSWSPPDATGRTGPLPPAFGEYAPPAQRPRSGPVAPPADALGLAPPPARIPHAPTRAPAAPAPQPTATVPVRRRGPAIAAALGVVVLGGGALGGWRWSQQTFATTVVNALHTPVEVAVGDSQPHVVPAQRQFEIRLRRGAVLPMRWHAADGRGDAALGDSLTVRANGPDVQIGRFGRAGAVVAPLVTNQSRARIVAVRANPDLRDQAGASLERVCVEDPRCEVAPGAVRQFVGHYPAFRNTAVVLYTDDGRSARYDNVGAFSDRRSGAAHLRVTDAALRPDPYLARLH
jgi:hypothetical protein